MNSSSRKKQSGLSVLLASIGLASALSFSAQSAPDFRSALKPLDDDVPEVAIARLQNLLGADLTLPEREMVTLKLGEALLRAGEAGKTLKVLDDPQVRGLTPANFWRAQACAALGRWQEAFVAYGKVLSDQGTPLTREALLGKADALRALGRKDEALQTFALLFEDARWKLRARFRCAELLIDKHDANGAANLLSKAQPQTAVEKQEKRFLRGRIEAELNHPEKALELFQTSLKKSEQTSRPLLIAALFAIADAHLQLKTPEAADDVLEDFIEHHPADSDLAQIFAKLDGVYQTERKPSRSALLRWTRDLTQPRRALAQWYLARNDLRAGRRSNAIAEFRALVNSPAKLPVLADGYMEFAQLEMDDERFDAALAILEAARSLQPAPVQAAKLKWLAAEANYRAKHFALAARNFETIAHSSPLFVDAALFNASLSWLQVGDRSRFLANFEELNGRTKDKATRAELLLEQGLMRAAHGDENAARSLQQFVHDFPTDARVSEAWVTLAELAFHASPPRLEEARADLTRAMQSAPTTVALERGDYLNIWIEDSSASDDAKVVALANQFLQKHANSRFVPEVRMKLAEAYYRRQDFANAQTQFELLSQEDPNSPFVEKALFFAAESAMASMSNDSLDHALALFDDVVRKNGELKWAARNEQAVIERKLGKSQEALVLYDEVLKANARASEKREALCGKGDIYLEMGAADSSNYKRAIEHYDQLISDPDTPSHWRHQALFKKGVCLEKTTDRSGALGVFYHVLENEERLDHPREFFWFYKAGFNAARLLEDDAKWNSAAVIYQKLAAAGGTRSDEAKARLAQLRLEHFLWEQ